jgi:hypothetical protein
MSWVALEATRQTRGSPCVKPSRSRRITTADERPASVSNGALLYCGSTLDLVGSPARFQLQVFVNPGIAPSRPLSRALTLVAIAAMRPVAVRLPQARWYAASPISGELSNGRLVMRGLCAAVGSRKRASVRNVARMLQSEGQESD